MELMAEALLNEAEHFPCDQLTARDYARNLVPLLCSKTFRPIQSAGTDTTAHPLESHSKLAHVA